MQRRAVGVSNRLHQQPHDVITAGEKLIEQFANRLRLIVEEVHPAGGVEEPLHHVVFDAEFLDHNPRKIFPIERRPQRKLRVLESNALQLHNRVGDFLRPILSATLFHPEREAVQRDIENVPVFPLEPGGHAAQLVMVLQQQHRIPGPRENIGRSQAGESSTDDDHVVVVARTFEEVFGHNQIQGNGDTSQATREPTSTPV